MQQVDESLVHLQRRLAASEDDKREVRGEG